MYIYVIVYTRISVGGLSRYFTDLNFRANLTHLVTSRQLWEERGRTMSMSDVGIILSMPCCLSLYEQCCLFTCSSVWSIETLDNASKNRLFG